MKKLILLTLLITFKSLNAQINFEWAKMMSGSECEGKSIVVDEKGNSYITGFFTGTVDFDPSPNVFNLISTGGGDVFICKLNNVGNLVWAKSLQGSGPTSGSSHDEGLSIALDSLGNVYTTGFFRKTVDFDPGPNTYNLTVTGSIPENEDVFVLKLDSLGDFNWAIKIGNGANGEQGNSITTDNNGFAYVTGIAEGGHFIKKINSQTGLIIWSKSFTGSGDAQGYSIKVDSVGNVYSVGKFNNTVDFDPGLNTYNLTSLNAGIGDGFVSKLDSLGNFIWAKSFAGNSTSYSFASSFSLDDFGNLIVHGEFSGTVDFDPSAGISNLSANNASVYLAKLDTSGNYVWSRKIENARVYSNPFPSTNSLSVDKYGDIYITGSFQNTVDFDPGVSTYNLTSQGGADIFICLLDSAGGFKNALSFGASGLSTNDAGLSIAVDKNLSIYSTGFFRDLVDFDPSSSIFNLNGSATTSDIFILKLSQCTNVFGTDNINSCDSYTWIDNVTYTSNNNTATHTLPNGAVNGCDSIVTLNLTMNNSTTGTDVVSACDSYTWIDNVTYTSSNITATHTLTGANVNGCDSIVTLNLTMNNSTTGTDVVNACDSYIWIDNVIYTSSNSSATHTLTNANVNGCDSIVTLNLTIINIDNSITNNTPTLTANQGGATYRWLDCVNGNAVILGETSQNFTPTISGNYAVEITVGSCVDTSSCINIVISSILEHDKIAFNMFPNPTNDYVLITIEKVDVATQLVITNVEGKIVYNNTSIHSNQLVIDVSKFEKGFYFVTVKNKLITNTLKLIKN